MCDGKLPIAGQIKCTLNSKCWCMKIETKIPHFETECMSPFEMLEEYEDIITKK